MNTDSTAADEVIYFDTEAGAALFAQADEKLHFWTLCRYFISEKFMTYCGVATGVTVLNSLGIPAPDEPQIYPYKMFTQDNLFTDEVLHIRRPREVERNGMSLNQLARILGVFDVQVQIQYGEEIALDAFRTQAIEVLGSPQQRLIVDFDRSVLKQKGAGHFSPLAAYDSKSDRFLMLDVARYKLPPSWVQAEMLWSAMKTKDLTADKSRGFLVVTRQTPDAST